MGTFASMTDAELLDKYVRVRLTPVRIMIEVKVVGPPNQNDQEASVRWSLAATLPKISLVKAVERARLMTLSDRRYFRVCDDCGVKVPAASITDLDNGTEVCAECLGGV